MEEDAQIMEEAAPSTASQIMDEDVPTTDVPTTAFDNNDLSGFEHRVLTMTATGGEMANRNLGIVFVDCFRRMKTTMIHLNADVQAIDAFSRSVVDMIEAVEVEILAERCGIILTKCYLATVEGVHKGNNKHRYHPHGKLWSDAGLPSTDDSTRVI